MSKKLQNKLDRAAKKQESQSIGENDKVYMKFSKDMYYNDLTSPIFSADKVYCLEGAGWITRWMKRGGEIVGAPKDEEVAVSNPQSPMPTADIIPRKKSAPEEKEPSEEGQSPEELLKQSEEIFNDEDQD